MINTKGENMKTKTYEITSVLNENGDYIGDPDFMKMLAKYGIQSPELAQPEHKVCSIGFSESDGKWYGWSHRTIYGFKVGSKVAKGDCAYTPTDKDDFLDDMVRFWQDESRIEAKGEHTTQEIMYSETVNVGKPEQKSVPSGEFESGVYVSWTYAQEVPNEKLRGTASGTFHPYPDEYGRGAWVAKTLEDAKQMAKDFASGVSCSI